MIPYDREFIINKINEYNEKIHPGKSGSYKIFYRDGLKGKVDGYLYEKEDEYDLKIPELIGEERIWMRVSPKEIQSTFGFIKFATGKVGVVGLGLGYLIQELAKKEDINEIIVYEISEDVIDLYYSNFKENPKVKILNEDAFNAKPEIFDYFFVDIYEYKLSKKVVDDYNRFIKLHTIENYSFWGVEHFMLSCNLQEIIWVFIPEFWMELSQDYYKLLNNSGYIEHYVPLDDELVSSVLSDFKEILND